VVAKEFVVNRLDLAAKVGHLCVACQLVAAELRHLVSVVMRDTSLLPRPGEAVLARGPLAPLDQHMQSAPQTHEPPSQIGRYAHATDVTAAAKHIGVKYERAVAGSANRSRPRSSTVRGGWPT
jgi:hypothetical protein